VRFLCAPLVVCGCAEMGTSMPTLGEEDAVSSAEASRALPSSPASPAPGDAPSRQGKIEVSARAIATVAGRAVADSYGVVGIAARRARFGGVEILTPEHYSRGVDVRFEKDHVRIDLYVVLEHGLRITTIAHNIMANVKFAVERTLGLRVVQVNVNVQGLRVSEAH
jgi:uncharacterized alkaline shock family protein YloU